MKALVESDEPHQDGVVKGATAPWFWQVSQNRNVYISNVFSSGIGVFDPAVASQATGDSSPVGEPCSKSGVGGGYLEGELGRGHMTMERTDPRFDVPVFGP